MGIGHPVSGRHEFYACNVDTQGLELGEPRFRVRLAGLAITPLIVLLLVQLVFETFFPRRSRQRDGVQVDVHRAADLLDG